MKFRKCQNIVLGNDFFFGRDFGKIYPISNFE